MQQDRDRNGAFLRSNIYEDRPRHTYSTPGTSVQDLKAPRYGNRSPDPSRSLTSEFRGRREPRQVSPMRPMPSIQGTRYRNDSVPAQGRPPESAYGHNGGERNRDSYFARYESETYTRSTNYTSRIHHEQSPQRWPPTPPLPHDEYGRRTDSASRREREEPIRQSMGYNPRSERFDLPTRSPSRSSSSYFPHVSLASGVYERPSARDMPYYTQQAQQAHLPAIENFRTTYAYDMPDAPRFMRPIPTEPRGSQFASQFASASIRDGDRYLPGEIRNASIYRGSAAGGSPSRYEVAPLSMSPSSRFGNPTAPSAPGSGSREEDPRRGKPAAGARSLLSLRDSLPPSKSRDDHKAQLRIQLERYRAQRLRAIDERTEKDRARKRFYRKPAYLQSIELNTRNLRPIPTQPRRSRTANYHAAQNGVQGSVDRGHMDRDAILTSSNTSEPSIGAFKGTPRLKIDTSLDKSGEREQSQPSRAAPDGLSTADSTPIHPPPSEEDPTEGSSPTDATLSSLSAWQGVSTAPRDAMVRIFATKAFDQQAIINGIKERVFQENEATIKSHGVKRKQVVLQNYKNVNTGIPVGKIRDALVCRFRSQEEELENIVKMAQRKYRAFANRWEQQCRLLDEQVQPEEPVNVSVVEPPLTGRVGRRNKGGPSDLVHSEFDVEQFLQKQLESDRVDAELLGRQNAADIPDMIAVTKERFVPYSYQETNSLVDDPERFYNYWKKDPWSEEEKLTFFELLAEVGKKFGVIAGNPALRHRSVQDCVRFYYRNKADVKYMELANHSGKRKGTKRSGIAGKMGGLLGDIRAEEDKKTEKVYIEEEIEEDSDSAYEQEGYRRKPAKPRGRGRGRGRGGWRGRGVVRAVSPALADSNGDVDMADAPTTEGDPGSNGWPGASTENANPRKRKTRPDEGDEDGNGKFVEKKKPISSYWHLKDRERMKDLIERYGDDYDTISAELTQKSGNQVKNYIRGRADLAEFLEQVMISKNLTAP